VVSEERGTASIALNGTLREIELDELELTVRAFLIEKLNTPDVGKQDFWRNLIIHNWIEKALSILLAVILWIALLA